MLALGVMQVLLTGSVPLTSSFSESMPINFHLLGPNTNNTIATDAGVSTELSDPKAPYAVPTLMISFFYHAAMAVFCYARYNTSGQTAFILGSIGSGGLASVGLWVILFSSSSGRISRKTGADKRTSGFPFSNKESASSKKKQMGKAI